MPSRSNCVCVSCKINKAGLPYSRKPARDKPTTLNTKGVGKWLKKI